MSGNRSKSAFFEGGWVTLSADFRRKEASPTNHCWCQSSRVIALSCGIKIAVRHSVLSQSTRVTDRQTDGRTDGQTDRITTPKTALAYARAVKKTMFKHSHSTWHFIVWHYRTELQGISPTTVCQSLKLLVASTCDLPDVINCQFREFTTARLWPVHFLSPDQESGIHFLIICGIQLLTPNNLGETWRRICSLDIRSVRAL